MSQPQNPLGQQQLPQQQQPTQSYVYPTPGYGPPPQYQPGQPYPQQPPIYPEVKPLPPNWQQPVQPGQWNPSGVYGGVPGPKKGMPWWGTAIILVLALGIIATIGIVVRSGATSTPEPAATIAANNSVVTNRPAPVPTKIPPTSIAVGVVVENKAVTPTLAPAIVTLSVNGYHAEGNVSSRTPNAGNSVYFIVDFSVINNSDKPLLTSPLYFKIQSKQNFSYEYSDVTYLLPKGFKSTTLAPNETTRGEIAFEVPNGESIVSGRYEDVFGNKVTKPIG